MSCRIGGPIWHPNYSMRRATHYASGPPGCQGSPTSFGSHNEVPPMKYGLSNSCSKGNNSMREVEQLALTWFPAKYRDSSRKLRCHWKYLLSTFPARLKGTSCRSGPLCAIRLNLALSLGFSNQWRLLGAPLRAAEIAAPCLQCITVAGSYIPLHVLSDPVLHSRWRPSPVICPTTQMYSETH